MTMKLKALAAAALTALLATGAQAQLITPGSGTTASNPANGSLIFAALDQIGNPISFSANLDYQLLSVLPTSTGFNTPGTTIVWDFKLDTVTVNGVARPASSGNYQYSNPYATFFSTAQSSDLTWGVFTADNNGNTTATANNLARRNFSTTGNPDATNIAAMTNAKVGNVTGQIGTFVTVQNTSTAPNTIQSGIGAQTATSGIAYLGDFGAIATDFAGQLTWEYMIADKASSAFTFVSGGTSGTQIGGAVNYGTAAGGVSTFTFDSASGQLTWNVTAVPEPGTYALMLSGLAVMGFVARRRRQG